MNYTDFINRVADKGDYSRVATKEVAKQTFATLSEILSEGEDVRIPALGWFYVSEIKARTVPGLEGKMVDLPANKIIRFKPSVKLKREVKGAAK